MTSATYHDSMSFSPWAEVDLTIDDLRRALAARDPDLPWLVVRLATGRDPSPRTPVRDGAPTLDRMRSQMNGYDFRKKSVEERSVWRRAAMAELEAPNAEVGLPPRFGLSELLLELWAANGPWERQCLLEIVTHVPLRWGPWRAIKRIYKEAEDRADLEMFGAIAARIDVALSTPSNVPSEISRATLVYMARRAWRSLRRTAESLPALYPDAACAVLRFYPEHTNWARTWIANHIMFHETGKYSRSRFKFYRVPSDLLKHRAYAELWQRTPRPLFTLLERADAGHVQRFATSALRSDFRATLREVEPAWVARLVQVGSAVVDEFVIWLFENVSRFEQGAFRELGLHDAVLQMLDSPSSKARAWVASYARTHARDLPLERLLELANNDSDEVRKLVRDLLRDRDPRKDVGLDAWGRLLGTPYGHELATAALRKHFGARELTPDWFFERLLSDDWQVQQFAADLLPSVHKPEKLGWAWFVRLLDDEGSNWTTANIAAQALSRMLKEADLDDVRRLLLHPQAGSAVRSWIGEHIAPEDLGADFLKRIAFHPGFDKDPWTVATRARARWARDLEFDDSLSHQALDWLRDVRRFSPDELGFDWLMQLVARDEVGYHEFAVEYMIKAFVPADFAPADAAGGAQEEAPAGDGEINVDLGGASFVFTGKLNTMTRSEAQAKVTAAGGTNSKGVSAKLDYLVIGDEGSPLYGQGRKGSKQLKAEKLIEEGSSMRVISETAFLQMLAGEQREFDEGASEAGCERLWELATAGDPSGPLSRFARRYILRHHLEIGPEMSDRPVDPGAEIPSEFLSFERVRPLLARPEQEIRSFGLTLARYELARWAPPIESIVSLAELPHDDVRNFVRLALLADESREHRRYRIDPAVLTPDAVYGFCESLDPNTRALGMALIARDARLAVPEELFRLTESPDRQVRAFAISTFWSLYRDRGITADWQPSARPEPEPVATRSRGRKRRAAAEEAAAAAVEAPSGPPPRPEQPPAGDDAMRDLLRRVLFGIPPTRGPRQRASSAERLKPLPARKAKQALVEVVRDLAVEDRDFAEHVVPVLNEFMPTRGQSERAACLVALTRIHRSFPELDIRLGGGAEGSA